LELPFCETIDGMMDFSIGGGLLFHEAEITEVSDPARLKYTMLAFAAAFAFA
jgi:hypothetical protein